MMLLLCLSAFLVLVQSFPESESPVLGVPKLIVPPTRSCTIQILTAACSGYNQVTQAPFTFPKNCNKPDDWAQIVLHLHGAVQGVQFDRYGAFWINGLEVLRLTTPEPTQKGITWDVEKDVSDLKTYFKSNEKDLVSYLTIPNVVDSTYTGVLFVNITLTFYLANPSIGVEAIPDYQYLLPLTNAPIVSPDNPTAALTIAGTQKQTYDFSLNKIKEDIYMSDSLYAQVYASPHGCEEFYYTNVPNSASGSLGICGGGAYREILVEIDGIFANSIIPFPVVYTGGINPLLWRPLTGIMSFNIPAYVLDLSPFLGLLADGKTHNISVSVLNNDDQGYWLVDVGLLIKEGQQSDKKNDTNNRESTHKLLQKSSDNMIVKSTFDIYYDTGTQQTVNELQRIYKTDSGKRVPLFTFNTFASRRFYVKSTFMNANHRHLSRSVSNILSLNNTNNIAVNLMDSVDYTAQISNYKSVSTITTGMHLTHLLYTYYTHIIL